MANDPVWQLIIGREPTKIKYDSLANLPDEKELSPQDKRKLRRILKKQEEFEKRPVG